MHVQVHYILVGRQPAAHRWRKEKERVGAHTFTCVHFSISFQRWLCAAIHRRRCCVHWNGSLWSSYSLLLHMWSVWKRRRRSYGHRRLPLSTSSFISLFFFSYFWCIFIFLSLFFLFFTFVRSSTSSADEEWTEQNDRIHVFLRHLCVCLDCIADCGVQVSNAGHTYLEFHRMNRRKPNVFNFNVRIQFHMNFYLGISFFCTQPTEWVGGITNKIDIRSIVMHVLTVCVCVCQPNHSTAMAIRKNPRPKACVPISLSQYNLFIRQNKKNNYFGWITVSSERQKYGIK